MKNIAGETRHCRGCDKTKLATEFAKHSPFCLPCEEKATRNKTARAIGRAWGQRAKEKRLFP